MFRLQLFLSKQTEKLRKEKGIEKITVIYVCGADHYNKNINRGGKSGGFNQYFGKDEKLVACVSPRIEKGKVVKPNIFPNSGDFIAETPEASDHSSTQVRNLLVKRYKGKGKFTNDDRKSLESMLHKPVLDYVAKNHAEILENLS